MTDDLSQPLLEAAGKLVEAELGLHFPPERMSDLQRGIVTCARDLGFSDGDTCARSLLSRALRKTEREVLARHLTVGETYFFRDKAAFEAIEREVLPALIGERRGGDQRLRIWSAACCSGEEAYSLAICVRRALPDLAQWRVTLLGTDINPEFLRKAASGVFGEWSFRDTPPEFRNNYFRQVAGRRWEILPEIRRMVRFLPLNLATDVYPSDGRTTEAMDLIFCRNALIYFAADRAKRVVHDLGRCLSQSGWLVLGPNEVSYAGAGFTTIPFPGAALHRKRTGQEEVRPSPPVLELGGGATVKHELATMPSPGPDVWPANKDVEPAPPADLTAPPALSASEAGDGGDASDPLSRARTLANQGDSNAALAAFDAILRNEKTNHIAHYLRAGILQEQGELAESTRALQRALYLEPEFVLAHFALGNLARNQGGFALADRHLRNALLLARARPPGETLPEADGLTAARLVEIITALLGAKAVA